MTTEQVTEGANDEMQEIISDFLVEADELIVSLDADLVKLESSPHDLDLLNSIFRAAHTIKGTSSFLGFDQVTSLTHRMEDILNRLRKAEMVVTPDVMDLLLESLDLLKTLLDQVRDGSGEALDIEDILARLAAGLTSQDNAASSGGDQPVSRATEPAVTNRVESEAAPEGAALSSKRAAPEKKAAADQTIRVDVNRLDTLMNLMGELVLGRNSLTQTIGLNGDGYDLEKKDQLAHAVSSINYITTELQLAVMKMRMQPIGKVFSKFPRLVRDLSRDSGKDIELVITGEQTELDKSVIEEIGDPLVHILRNSCDHGIEDPAERFAKGKQPRGTIQLQAGQEGSNIVIRIQDDGKGLDVAAIRAKAIERGLVTASDAEKMPDKEVFQFIFGAGFSTAKKITDVSGRGVGMDVVRTNIERLNGMIELDSVKDQGTTISIKLPLTLAIIQGLLVKSDDDIFILPLASVLETVKTEQSSVSYVNQRPVLQLRSDVIPIINLNQVLQVNRAGLTMTEKPYIVIVGLAEKKLGIMIDRFLGQEEVVIKSLGRYLGSTEGIAGATILGDGRIRLIVDLIGLFAIARRLR